MGGVPHPKPEDRPGTVHTGTNGSERTVGSVKQHDMSVTEPQPAVRKPSVRWYHLTPGHFVIALLAVEVLLWLSERFGWLAWHKGYAVLTAVAGVGVAMLVMLGWFAVALLFHRRFQFSIRSLLVFVVFVAIPCSWLAVEMKRAEKQREVVDENRIPGGFVWYDYQCDASDVFSVHPNARPPGPAWLRNLLGDDFFSHVRCVNTQVTDAGLTRLAGLPELEALELNGSTITDAGLAQISRLNQLQGLSLDSTQITDTGLAHLAERIQLHRLGLNNTKVTNAGLSHLRGLTHLQCLELDGTKITDEGLAHIAGLTQLYWLWLANTQITDGGLSTSRGADSTPMPVAQ